MASDDTSKSLGATAESIQYHYDISNDFYKLWLDSTMSYSAALWEEGDTLEEAQFRKLDYHIDQAAVKDGMRVLDVGCGWGGLLHRIENSYSDIKGVGLTLSQAQADHIKENVPHDFEVRLESWKDHTPEAPYDAIISVGAFEHFAKQDLSEADRIAEYRAFFRKSYDLLEDGGRLSLQTIACGNMLREDFSEFFATQIFPESDLPRLSEILEASEFLFETKAVRNDRYHYGKTLREWKRNIRAKKDEAIGITDPEVYKRYFTYFHLAIISFERLGSMDLLRITFEKTKNPRKL
jgi:cyclopropane-fatty-acyl-phospholipid synthase